MTRAVLYDPSRLVIADLYSGAGGAAMGYWQAGFQPFGVDHRPQPNYPFPFVQEDALAFLRSARLAQVAAVHASPPCHDHSKAKSVAGLDGTGWVLGETRRLLVATARPWIIENVPGAPMRTDFRLCGCMFGLDVRRERWFETSWRGFDLNPGHNHSRAAVTIYGHGGSRSNMRGTAGAYVTVAETRVAIGIGWMTTDELSLAVPPAYTEYVARSLRAYLETVTQ